jgi:Tfp pilus assembly protein PilV
MIFKINVQKTNLQKGFMMTEVLITALLIVIAMVGVLPLLFTGVKSSKTGKTRAILSNILQKEIEDFNQSNFSTVSEHIRSKLGATDYDEIFTQTTDSSPKNYSTSCLFR